MLYIDGNCIECGTYTMLIINGDVDYQCTKCRENTLRVRIIEDREKKINSILKDD